MSKVIFDAPLSFIKCVVKGEVKSVFESCQRLVKDVGKYVCDLCQRFAKCKSNTPAIHVKGLAKVKRTVSLLEKKGQRYSQMFLLSLSL